MRVPARPAVSISWSLAFIPLVAVSGCSGDNAAASPSSSSDAETSPSSDAASTLPEVATEADALVDAGPQVRTGFVRLNSNRTPAQTRVVATFLEGGPAYNCPELTFGDCAFVRCTLRVPADKLPAPNSGTLSIKGGAKPLELLPIANGTYDVFTQAASLWMGGETLSVSSTGGGIAAFVGTVTAPARVTLTAPVIGTGDWSLSRATDLSITWTGGGTEDIVVLFGTMSTEDPNEVECHFPASGGKGTVPSSALKTLPAGDAYYSMASRNVARVSAGNWSVNIKAESDAVGAGGSLVQGTVTLR